MDQAAEIPETGEHRGQLISREVNNAVHAAFNALAQTVLVNNSRTLEDLLREMLQPILKVWLNDNLPGIVERLVRVEIEQLSPRRRQLWFHQPLEELRAQPGPGAAQGDQTGVGRQQLIQRGEATLAVEYITFRFRRRTEL